MEPSAPVVVDTQLWIEFFSGKRTAVRVAIDALLRVRAVRMVGPVLYELLIGPRDDGQRQYLSSRLRMLPMLATTDDVWLRAAELGRLPSVIIRQVPASDVLIAAHCDVYRCSLYARDPHFDAFPDLPRYTP